MKYIKINYGESIPDNYTGIVVYPDTTKGWFKEGKQHREDGPAVESLDGKREWCLNGLFHRIDGPAIEYPDGYKKWYKEGELHREDGPAIEYPDGRKKWWIEDNHYSSEMLSELIESSLYLGKEKGRYNLEWLKFLTENRFEEFPIIPGMKEYKNFKPLFEKLEISA
jgi:hypothetical protein